MYPKCKQNASISRDYFFGGGGDWRKGGHQPPPPATLLRGFHHEIVNLPNHRLRNVEDVVHLIVGGDRLAHRHMALLGVGHHPTHGAVQPLPHILNKKRIYLTYIRFIY